MKQATDSEVTMPRLAAGFIALIALASPGLTSPALAQLTETPGYGGTRIAPGAPVHGYTPGGTGIGGTEIAPGPAARGLPMYRQDPAGNPVLVMPQRGEKRARSGGAGAVAATAAPCPEGACLPEGLRLTIDSSDAPAPRDPGATVDSMTALRTALRACWAPPAEPRRSEVQMSVRFSFRRSGELIAPPFVTYASPGANAEMRQSYRRSITAAFDQCAPLKFSPQFAAGIAGHPISVRFVDGRERR